MKLSVIIPVYNQAQYLGDALDSILYQTVKPHEVVVVNDGSSDDSLKIAKEYPVKIINQVNKGLAPARNTGLMNLTGDYVLFLDADDMLLEKCIERIVEVINESKADIVAPSFKQFGLQQNHIILSSEITLEMYKTKQNYLPYFSAIKVSKLKEIGGYSPRMTWGFEDLHLWIDLLSRGAKVVTIPEILVLYRVREGSMYTESIKHIDELHGQINKDFKIYA